MSRGPGRWQRVILQALAENTDHDIFGVYALVEEHLGRTPTRSELVAARRAVKTLAIQRKVRAIYRSEYRVNDWSGPHLCVIRHDADFKIGPLGRGGAISDWITCPDGKTELERDENR
jgi:hypothetical protein